MCAEVRFDDGKSFPAWEAETRAELQRRMGGPLVLEPRYAASAGLTGDSCLCGVDLAATALKYGYRYEQDDSGFEITFSTAAG